MYRLNGRLVPPALVAVMEYAVEGLATDGVPVIWPVVVLSDKPVGSGVATETA